MVDHELAGRDQVFDVIAERGDVRGEILRTLLEAHEHAGLAEAGRAVDQERHAEQRLATARGAAQQRRPADRQAAQRQIVQAVDPGGCLRQLMRRVIVKVLHFCNGHRHVHQ
jgi:hypothetical protein